MSKPQKTKNEEVKETKPSNSNYFTDKTEDAIVKFQQETSIAGKQAIFMEEIRPAFLKLVENIIFVYKFHTLGDVDMLKNDCMSFLFESLNKYNVSKRIQSFLLF